MGLHKRTIKSCSLLSLHLFTSFINDNACAHQIATKILTQQSHLNFLGAIHHVNPHSAKLQQILNSLRKQGKFKSARFRREFQYT